MELTGIGTPALWIGFTSIVLGLLVLDLGVFHRDAHEVRFREALTGTVVRVALALLFNGWVYWQFGGQRGLEFLTGYLIEQALAVDNMFVFLVIFSTFGVPPAYQYRVLFFGIVGALVMRAAFIVLGGALLHAFHWVNYVFGAFLVFTGIKLLFGYGAEMQPERNPLFRLFKQLVPSLPEYHGARFTVVKAGRRYATPLLLVVVCIEATDVVFAVDSIPAIFAVTTDPFIVYTSNIFAILGLRALFFLLAGLVGRLAYLNVGLAAVMSFVGVKMMLSDVYPISILISLGGIATVLALSVVASWLRPPVSTCGARAPARGSAEADAERPRLRRTVGGK